MAAGIVIFGPAGAGKTTLGMMTAALLNWPYFDFDDYIWRKDTDEPFTVRVPEEEKLSHLLDAIRPNEHFVLAGYMDRAREALDEIFSLAVYITAPPELRVRRIRERDQGIFGERVLPGGDMYETHEQFIRDVLAYDDEDQPFIRRHKEWAESLHCPVITLDGGRPLYDNLKKIIEAWKQR